MSTETVTAQSEDVKKLAKMIHGIDFAMFTTATEEGSLRSRPMSTQKTEFDGSLWFFSDIDSGKMFEVEQDRHVNLAYAEPQNQRYISVSGRATISRDKAKIKELWSPAIKAWYPEGPDDPKIALIRVDVDQAEYWDNPNNKVVTLIGFIKATMTGERYMPGDHAKMNLA